MGNFTAVNRPVAFRFHEGLGVLESHHAPSFWMEERKDPEAKVLFAMSGKGILFTGKRSLPLVAPCALLLPSLCPHRIEDASGALLSLAGIGFRAPFPCLDLVRRVCSEVQVVDAQGTQQRLGDGMRELLMEERRGVAGSRDIQLCAAIRLLLILDTAEEGHGDARQRVRNRLYRAEQEPWRRVDLDNVAAETGLSRRRFSQLCRELTGESWVERGLRLRLQYAGRLLLEEQLAISMVAFECGYGNMSAFHRDFKKWWGHTPGEHSR